MQIDLDVSDVERYDAFARETLDAWPGLMWDTINQFVLAEKEGHRYENQTGHAEALTLLQVVSETDRTLDLEASMGVEYASYLQDGWSSFDDYMRQAQLVTRDVFERLGDSLTD